jgi:hypothetical protein
MRLMSFSLFSLLSAKSAMPRCGHADGELALQAPAAVRAQVRDRDQSTMRGFASQLIRCRKTRPHWSPAVGTAPLPRSLARFPSPDSRCNRRQIHFHSPPHSGCAVGIELNRLNDSGQADNMAGAVQRDAFLLISVAA